MAAKLEWLEADDWQRETLTEFTIGQAEKPHNDIATVWFDAGATVSTTREEAAELARMFAAAPDMFEALAGSDSEMAATTGPLSWLREAIKELKARGPADEDSDPPAYWEMVGEIEAMERKCSAALSKARGDT